MFPSFNARAAGLDLPATEAIELAAREGFGGVDLMVRDLAAAGADVARLRARMDELGLRGGAFPLPVDWRGDASAFERDLARLPAHAAAAARLGLRRTGTWVLPETPPGARGPAARARAVALHVGRLGRVARALDGYGIRLGLEVIGVSSARSGRGEAFVHRLADLDRVLGAVWREAPNLGVLVDSFHLLAAGEPVEAGLAWGAERVVWVHVADLPAGASDRAAIRDDDRELPGGPGREACRELLARLAEAGYDGPVTAEPMGDCRSLRGLTPGQVARRIAGALRSVWPGAMGGS